MFMLEQPPISEQLKTVNIWTTSLNKAINNASLNIYKDLSSHIMCLPHIAIKILMESGPIRNSIKPTFSWITWFAVKLKSKKNMIYDGLRRTLIVADEDSIIWQRSRDTYTLGSYHKRTK